METLVEIYPCLDATIQRLQKDIQGTQTVTQPFDEAGERAAFEAWHKEAHPLLPRTRAIYASRTVYTHDACEAMWKGWLAAKRQAHAETGGWNLVSERLPPMDMPVWMHLPGGQIVQGGRFYADGEGWMWCNCYNSAWYDHAEGRWEAEDAQLDDDYEPTHWMPLPLPSNDSANPRFGREENHNG